MQILSLWRQKTELRCWDRRDIPLMLAQPGDSPYNRAISNKRERMALL